MPRFNLQRFIAETGLSIARLASYLQVAQTYLQQAAAGKTDLTRRDREACRALWRRLTQATQIELPFVESPSTFTREHARLLARSRARSIPVRSAKRAVPPGRPGKPAAARSRSSTGNPGGRDPHRREAGSRQDGPRIRRKSPI
jgi:hypothetical protein